jgi:hypothetical protein
MPPNDRLLRYILYLQAYDFDVEYIRGDENHFADYLSRPQQTESVRERTKIIKCYTIKLQSDLIRLLTQLAEEQDKEVELKILKNELENVSVSSNYVLQNHILFVKKESKWKVYLPKTMENIVLLQFHDFWGHFGVHKTWKLISKYFYFPSLRNKVKAYVKTCEICQRTKWSCQANSVDFRAIIPNKPFELCSVDIFGPLPPSTANTKYILLILDVFTKYVKFYAMRNATCKIVLNKIESYCSSIAKPNRILCDRGTQFTAKLFINKMQEQDIQLSYTAIRHPQANPVERSMRELGRLARAYCSNQHTSWCKYLPKFEYWTNSTIHHTTQHVPADLQPMSTIEEVDDIVSFPQSLNIDRLADLYDSVHQRMQVKAAANIRNRKALIKRKNTQLVALFCYEVIEFLHCLIEKSKNFFDLYDGPYRNKKNNPLAYLFIG